MPTNSGNLKSVVITPAMLGLTDYAGVQNSVRSPEETYARVPLVFRATRIRCNSLLKIPFHIFRDDGTTEAEWPFDYPLRKLIWRTRAAGLLTGAGYVLKRANRVTVKEVQWLNPTTMTVNWDYSAHQRMFDQYIQGEHFGPWTDREMVYIPEFSLRDDIGPGDCPAAVALGSAQLSHYVTRMASKFFEDGAMPVTLITSKTGFGTDTPKVEDFFRRAMQGIRNAFRVVAVRGEDVKVDRLQFPIKELAAGELRDQARKDVALAFEIPVTILDDDANYATAKEHKRGFYDETVIPDADVFAEEFNAQLLEPMGLKLEFRPEEMDLYQEDERESAAAAQTFASMIAQMPDFETFQFVAATYGIEYDDLLAKKVFAAKESRRKETMARFTAPGASSASPNEPPALPAPDGKGNVAKALKSANVTGVMIALPVPESAANALARAASAVLGEDAEITPPEQMHLTLAYFGDGDTLPAERMAFLPLLTELFAKWHAPLHGTIGGKGMFNHVDKEGRSAVYAAFDSPALPGYYNVLTELLDAAEIPFDRTHGFTPHITLGYAPEGIDIGGMELPDTQITFDSIVLARGGAWTKYPFAPSAKSAPTPEALREELGKWERAAVKRVKRGGDLSFQSDVIPPSLHASILGALEAVTDAQHVRHIFNNAATWGSYP